MQPRVKPDAAAEMSHFYQKMVREALDAGREIPAKPVPASLGEAARGAVDASQRLYRKAQSRTFAMSFSLKDLEAQRAAKAAAAKATPKKPAKKTARTRRAKGSK